MDGIRVRNRSEERISILVILRVQVLHDMIREFARDSFPSNACNFVRDVAARILIDGSWSREWTLQTVPEDDDEHGEWYLRRHLQHGFRVRYLGDGLVSVKHMTIADWEEYYRPRVITKVIVLEFREAGYPEDYDYVTDRFHRFQQSVQGHTWTAACASDWYKRDIRRSDFSELEYDDLSRLEGGESVYKDRGQKIDHIVDLSTLTLLRD
jgi:hypothetical protein